MKFECSGDMGRGEPSLIPLHTFTALLSCPHHQRIPARWCRSRRTRKSPGSTLGSRTYPLCPDC